MIIFHTSGHREWFQDGQGHCMVHWQPSLSLTVVEKEVYFQLRLLKILNLNVELQWASCHHTGATWAEIWRNTWS